MKLQITKVLSPLLSLFCLAACSFMYASSGHTWAMWCGVVFVSCALWIGIPAWLAALSGQVDDDRGRYGFYAYHDESLTKESDRWRWVYTFCNWTLVASLIAGRASYFDAIDVSVTDIGASMCLLGSLGMAYLQRYKGYVLVTVPLGCAILFAALAFASAARQ